MDDMKENLEMCCKKLRLSASLANRAMTLEGKSNQEYLLNLLTSEIANRDAARITRNMNMAGFPCRYRRDQYRTDEEGVVPSGDTVLLPGDMCYVVTYRETAWELEGLFRRKGSQKLGRVFVVGGGKVGFKVIERMRAVRKNVQIFLIERDRRRCEKLQP